MGLDPVTKFFIQLAVSYYSYNQQRKAQKRAERAARAARSNVMVNKQSNNDPIYPLYGRQRIGGTRAFIETTDGAGDISKTTHLCMALVIAEGVVDTIEQLWFNDTLVWDVDDASTPGTLTDNGNGGYTLSNFISKYAGAGMTWNWYPGTDSQTVCTDFQTAVNSTVAIPATDIKEKNCYEIVTVGDTDYTLIGAPDNNIGTQFKATADGTGTGTVKSTPWTYNHTLSGLSYMTMILNASGEIYGGQLPTFTAVLKGKKIFDVDTLVDGQTTWTGANITSGADQNPADVLYNYLTNPRYGKGLDRDEQQNWVAGLHIDLASFQQAKADCIAARSGDGFYLNGFLQTEKQIFDNVGEILETCNGMLLFVDGKYQFRIKKPNEQVGIPPSAIFTKDTIVGNISLSLPQKNRKYNKVTGTFNNPETKYNEDLVVVKDETYIEEDNGSVLESQEDYTMITNADHVEDLITQMMEMSREESILSFKAPHTALLLRSGDIIEVRHPEFGWGTGAGETQKFWRVQELKLADDNLVEISATTYDSSKEI